MGRVRNLSYPFGSGAVQLCNGREIVVPSRPIHPLRTSKLLKKYVKCKYKFLNEKRLSNRGKTHTKFDLLFGIQLLVVHL